MRYISIIDRHTILRNDGSTAYQFEHGELVIGDPTLNTAGNVIVAAPIVNNFEGSVMVLVPGGATDLEKVGLNTKFWAAPPITPGAGTVTAGQRYEVLTDTVINNGVTYKQRDIFVAVGTATSGTGTFSISIPVQYAPIEQEQFYNEHFKIAHTLRGDEASFSIQGPNSITAPAFTTVIQ